ncbi:MAG: AI-2E family transporter [Planctomycetota bacterium]
MNSSWRPLAFPVLALAAVLLLAWTLSEVLNPVLIAVLIAVILNPVVNLASRFRLPRIATVAVLYILLAVGLATFGSVMVKQFGQLGQALAGEPFLGDKNGNGLVDVTSGADDAEYVDLNANGVYDAGALLRLENWLDGRMAVSTGGAFDDALESLRTQVMSFVRELARPAGELIRQLLQQVAQFAGGLIAAMTLLVLIPFYLFFFLVEYPSMTAKLRAVVPPRYRTQVERIARDIGRELVAFLRGRLLCGLIKAVMLWIGMFSLGIEFALPIALVTGLLSLIPVVGFIVGVIPASVIALTMPEGGTEPMLWVLGLFVAAEVIEGAVLFPLVLGRETGLHPVTLVIVLLAGGALMGTLGVLVAIPLALVIKVLWRELGLPLYRAWANPPGPTPQT